jgi:hypothetical protein
MDQENKVDNDLRNALFQKLGVTKDDSAVSEKTHIDDTKAIEDENTVSHDNTTEKKSGKIKDLGFSALAEVLTKEIDVADKAAKPIKEKRDRVQHKIDEKLLHDLVKGFKI